MSDEIKTDLLDWVEKQAQENLHFRVQDTEALKKDSTTTLNILLAGMAGAFAYGMRLYPKSEGWEIAAVFVFATYLLALCAVLIFKCLKICAIPAPTNEPRNLYQETFTLEQLRKVELENVQSRIDEVVKRNNSVALWLNRVRLLAVCSPIVAAIVAWWAAR
jgi:hypothetical protein